MTQAQRLAAVVVVVALAAAPAAGIPVAASPANFAGVGMPVRVLAKS